MRSNLFSVPRSASEGPISRLDPRIQLTISADEETSSRRDSVKSFLKAGYNLWKCLHVCTQYIRRVKREAATNLFLAYCNLWDSFHRILVF